MIASPETGTPTRPTPFFQLNADYHIAPDATLFDLIDDAHDLLASVCDILGDIQADGHAVRGAWFLATQARSAIKAALPLA